MKHNRTCALAVGLRTPLRAAGLLLLAGVCTLSAATRQSANYAIEAEVLDHGGGVQTAGAVQHVGSLGGDFGAAPGNGGTFTILYGYISQVSDATNVANLVFVTQSTLPDGTNGTPYNVSLQATDGTPPITFAVITGALPPGLALSSSGLLAGAPTATGAFNFTVRATDALNATADRAFSLTIVAWTGTSYVWTGPHGGSWFTPTSWLPHGVPGPDDDATVTNGLVILSGVVSVRTLNFTNGTLRGYVTLNGTLNWTGGGFDWDAVLQVQSGSTINVLPGGAKETRRLTLRNAGAFHWNAPLTSAEGSIVNQAGGMMHLGTGSLVTGYANCNLTNELGGRLLVTTGTTIPANMPFTTAGAVEVANGTLAVESHLKSTGTWLLPDGSGLTLTGGGSFAGGTKFDGPAPVTLTGGTVQFGGEVTAPNLILAGASVSGGPSLKGKLDWTSGSFGYDAVLQVQSGSTVNVLPGGAKESYRLTLRNAGAFNWNSPLARAEGSIVNQAGGVMRLGTSPLVTGYVSCNLTNELGGRVLVTTGTTIPANMPFTTAGAVEVANGTLAVESHLKSTGTWLLPDGSGLTLTGGGSFAGGTKFDGPAPVTLTGGTVQCGGEVTAPDLILAGASVSGGLSLKGKLDWTSGGFDWDSVLQVQSGSTVNVLPGGAKESYRLTLRNAGVFNWNSPLARAEGLIVNQAGGRVVLRTETPVSGWASALLTNQPGATLEVRDLTGTVNWPAGISLDNQGALEIWQGILSLPGNYAPGATSSLKIGLGGSIAGGGHGQLAVAGSATLAGQIQAEATSGFTPSLGQEFTALTCASRAGTFANSTVNAGSGVWLAPDHRATSVVLVATNPPQLAVIPGSTTVVAGQTAQFAATNGTPPYTFTLATDNSGGSITTAGLYTAGGSGGVDTVRVTDSVGSNATASVTVVTCNSMLGLVAWWRGEDNPQDAIGSLHGTLNNGAGYVAGRVGRGIAFDGVNDSMSVPDSPAWDFGTTDLTIDLWLKLNAVESGLFVHQQSGAVAGGFEFFFSGAESALAFNANSSYRLITRPWSPAPDTWYHVAVVRTQSVCRLFVNGAQLGADQADGTAIANVTGPLLLGNWAGGSGYELNGVMDELSIYHRALSPAELQAIYNAGSAGKCPPVLPPQIVPATTNAAPGDTIAFTATNGTPPFTFAFATNNSGGSITTAGLYTAGHLPGTDTVRVTDASGSNATATVTVDGCASLAGQIAWWRGENDAQDSALTNHGALVNGLAFAPGRVGQAFSLDGVNDFVRVAPPGTFSPTGSMTFQAWIKPSVVDPAKTHTILSKANYYLGQTWWHLSLATNRLHFHISRNGINSGAKSVVSAPGLVLPEVWTHVAASWDAPTETLRLFINGAEVTTTPVIDTQINHLYESPEPVRIGCLAGNSGQATNFFAGLIDEVEVFSRAVPPAEIAFTVNGNRCAPTPCAPPPGNLIAWWRSEENGLDAASTNHGTLQNGAQFAPGLVGHAFSLDGANDYVRIAPPGTLSPTGSMTLQAWIKPAALGADAIHTIISKANAQLGEVWWHFSIATNRLHFFISRNGLNSGAKSVKSDPGLVLSSAWTHVAATWELPAEVMRLFVNGQEVTATPVIDTQINHLYFSTVPVRIGGQVDGAGSLNHMFNGLVDEVALHDRALAAAEIYAIARGCTTPPLVLSPANTSVPAGSTVQFTTAGGTPPYTFAFAANNSSGSLTAGGLYTAGSGCVNDAVRVTDAAGSNALATVTILDTIPPVITCPVDITVEATSPNGATASYLVTATDNCTARPLLVVSPPSGSTFALGTNDVTCQAVDGAGNRSVCAFKVIVRDTTPPNIVCPANVSVSTVNPAGEEVRFNVTASDAADGDPLVVATPPTATEFPPGTTTVNCVATDAAGNTSICSFTVTVTLVPTAFAVSGRVAEANNTPAAGVAVALTGSGVNTSATTDTSGNYLFSSIAPGSYTVTPTHPNFTITPASAGVTVATANVTRDFVATRMAIAISGRVTNCVTGAGVAGARVYATGVRRPALTDGGGFYSLPTVPLAAEIQVDVLMRDGRIEPGLITIATPAADVMANFCARPQVRVEGLVQDADGVGLDGCPVDIGGSVSTTVSTRAGRFLLRHHQGDHLTVTPSLADFLFDPLSLNVPELMSDVSATFVGVELPGLETPGRIAFGSFVAGQAQTMVVGDDGNSFPVALGPAGPTSGPDLHHAWTRDGSKVAFERGGFVCVMNADGSGFTKLTSLSGLVGSVAFPAWSPHGSKLAVVGSGGALWIANADGSGATRRLSSGLSGGASWSPDGTELAFPRDRDVVRIRANVTAGDPPPTVVATAFGSLASVAWSPDGNQFACVPWNAVHGPAPCFVIVTNGGSPNLVLPDADSLAWSPDGDQLAFTKSARLFSIRTNGTDLRQISGETIVRIGAHSWGPLGSFAAGAGANQTVGNSESTTVTFANVTAPGLITFNSIAPESTTLPPGYFSFGGESAVQIETTAQFSGPITVCFRVPDSTSVATFERLRIFHGETGVLMDRTILPPDSPAPNYATRTICARVTSLSPFVIGEQIDTALPQITGLVVDTNGNPIVDAFVLLTGSATNDTKTDLDGQFAFPNLSATGNYTVAVAQVGFSFTPVEMNLPALGTGADILFVGTNTPPTPVPSLAIAPDARFGNQLTLTWPGFPEEFVLESTDSLSNTNWSLAPELQFGTTNGVVVPLAPGEAQRFFRLRRATE